ISLAVLVGFGLANPLDRNHLLALGGSVDAHPPGGTAGEADTIHRHPHQLPAAGDQHDLVGILYRESLNQVADLGQFALVGGLDPLAAAIGDPELIGRRTLAVAEL